MKQRVILFPQGRKKSELILVETVLVRSRERTEPAKGRGWFI